MTPKTETITPDVQKALDLLATYNNGARRPELMPLDQAIMAAASHPGLSKRISAKLRHLLQRNPPNPAIQYICGKVAFLGSENCVRPLASLLGNRLVAADARTALEAISDPSAGRAIIQVLPKLKGELKAGAIASLGSRGDSFALRPVAAALRDPDPLVQKAARLALLKIEKVPSKA